MKQKKHIDYRSLGIDLRSKNETQLFRWLLACLLFGKPIQQEVAANAYKFLVDAGITSLDKLAVARWDKLVALLDTAHYVRYDFSTATKLLTISKELKEKYGTVRNLLEVSKDTHDLENRLIEFKGVGPVTASIFVRGVAPIWFEPVIPHDYEVARRVAAVLSGRNFEAYIIGGAVRDLLLGIPPKDFDIVTNATPDQIMAIDEFSQAKYKDPAQAFGVTRVKFAFNGKINMIEIATFRKDVEAHRGRKATKVEFADLEGDVARRDLTINALALDPSTNQVIDYVGGIDDIASKTIRFIGDPDARMQEDPLRLMRTIRFKNHLGFSYSPESVEAITRAVTQGHVNDIAIDRLRDELTHLLRHVSRRGAVVDLDLFGILELVMPEVTAGKHVAQPPQFHEEGDVWQHELLVLDYLPTHPSKRLAWAALLHDIGKPPTSIEPHNSHERIRFDGHYAVGAELAKTILLRLNFANKDIRDITWMIYNHMSIDDLPSMRPSRQQRMLSHPAFEDLLELHRADAAASWRAGHKPGEKPDFRIIEQIWHEYQSRPPHLQQPSLKRDLGIDGHWLMAHFGEEFELKGPVMGRVLRELADWYCDQGVTDKVAYETRARYLLSKTARP